MALLGKVNEASRAPAETLSAGDVEDLEIELLLEGIFRRYGYDFREYDRSYIRKRVEGRLQKEGLVTASQLLARVLRAPESLDAFLEGMGDAADSFCRPARLWRTLRRKAMPLLRTYPSVRAWAAGCRSQADLVSLLLVLEEELSRSYTLYMTDFHEGRMRRIRSDAFRRKEVPRLAKLYAAAGGKRRLTYYLENNDGHASIHPNLSDRLVFGLHNPTTDASFNEFHLILARDAMRGFNASLRARVHGLIYESLVRFGYVVFGAEESLEGTPYESRYKAIDRTVGLYQKIGS
jgi:chemotaxis protein methyltransferase CheR